MAIAEFDYRFTVRASASNGAEAIRVNEPREPNAKSKAKLKWHADKRAREAAEAKSE